jgi:hypothetical protein
MCFSLLFKQSLTAVQVPVKVKHSEHVCPNKKIEVRYDVEWS